MTLTIVDHDTIRVDATINITRQRFGRREHS